MSWKVILRDALIGVAVSAALALGSNAMRSERRLPLIAERDYQVLVPCPEAQRPAQPISPAALTVNDPRQLLVDARDAEAFARWHLPGAISIPYDYLEPRPEEQRVLRSGVGRVVVYGDGEEPDSGQQLANAFSSRGVKNVFYVRGGAPALKGRLRR